jgi:Na+-driven multidrug efflux pump
MYKNDQLDKGEQQYELPWIAYIIAFLIGILLFLFFGKTVLGIEPNMLWIAVLMGLSASAVVFWVWGQIRTKNRDEDDE